MRLRHSANKRKQSCWFMHDKVKVSPEGDLLLFTKIS